MTVCDHLVNGALQKNWEGVWLQWEMGRDGGIRFSSQTVQLHLSSQVPRTVLYLSPADALLCRNTQKLIEATCALPSIQDHLRTENVLAKKLGQMEGRCENTCWLF